MARQYLNNFLTSLDADMPIGSTSMTLPLAEAAKMSTASVANPYRLTLSRNGFAEVEVIEITNVSGAVCSVTRKVETVDGAAGVEYNWLTGELVECLVTKDTLEALAASGTLGGLSDVDLTGAVDTDRLALNAASGMWEPDPAGGGGGGSGYGDLGAVADLGDQDSGTNTIAVATNTSSLFRVGVIDTTGAGTTLNLDLAAPGSGAGIYKCVIVVEQGADVITNVCSVEVRDSAGDSINVISSDGSGVSFSMYESSDANGKAITLFTVNNGGHWYSDWHSGA